MMLFNKDSKRQIAALFGLCFCLLIGPVSADDHWNKKPKKIGGHNSVMTVIANGAYDLNDPDYVAPDFNYFTSEIMGWDEVEAEIFIANAKEFFISRFGVDPDDPTYVGRVVMVPFMVDPRWEYRVYSVTGQRVPRRGWVLRDGGVMLIATDPEGVELGGEFAGQHAAFGSVGVYGIFNVERKYRKRQSTDLIMYYQSREPVLQNSGFPLRRDGQGTLIAPFEVYSEALGKGWAFAHIWETLLYDGRIQTNNRNIITFPAGASYPSK